MLEIILLIIILMVVLGLTVAIALVQREGIKYDERVDQLVLEIDAMLDSIEQSLDRRESQDKTDKSRSEECSYIHLSGTKIDFLKDETIKWVIESSYPVKVPDVAYFLDDRMRSKFDEDLIERCESGDLDRLTLALGRSLACKHRKLILDKAEKGRHLTEISVKELLAKNADLDGYTIIR